ncbi:MAG: hypothetical protein PVJ86_02650 [Phycisphaerales bacterium]|jgi:hypothetical protein
MAASDFADKLRDLAHAYYGYTINRSLCSRPLGYESYACTIIADLYLAVADGAAVQEAIDNARNVWLTLVGTREITPKKGSGREDVRRVEVYIEPYLQRAAGLINYYQRYYLPTGVE